MNRIVAGLMAVGFAVSGLLISAPVATAAEAASVPAASQKDKRFLADIRSDEPAFRDLRGPVIVKAAKQVCKTLKAGVSAIGVIGIAVDAGFDDDEIVALLANSVFHYCPGQAYKFG